MPILTKTATSAKTSPTTLPRAADHPVLQPGETCWRIARADRMAVIVDAADYFEVLHAALQQAQHSIIMIGWEFDTRISLRPDQPHGAVPTKLGRFFNWLIGQNPDLHIHLLEWDLGMINALGRGTTPLRVVDWLAGDRIHLKLDHAHPSGAAHHQKIVVIDDALAFCGGIDMTTDRWDRRDHRDDDPLRKRPTTGRHYGPWHDATVAVDGEAARALGIVARDRWRQATGEELAPPPAVPPLWPEDLAPTFTAVDVAISRTAPEYDGRPPVHEIEKLYLAIIAAARDSVYIESQYFASRKIAEAIAARLGEADGPEFVIVNPLAADGWLEEEVMGSSRARLLDLVGKADIHDRFRLYTPVAAGGTPIYVHAKIVAMDDRLLRVGSSNLNNRSLGMDTECDLTIEADPASAKDKDLRARITDLRNDLLAEHLGGEITEVAQAIKAAGGSLIAAIEALRGEGRTLEPFTPPDLNGIEKTVMAENDLLDPERPARRWRPFRLLRR